MAKNKVYIDVVVDDKGTTQRVAVNAKKLGLALDETAVSAQTADRRMKGASQQSANGTKNFSKMAQGISGGLVPAYATLAAQVFAVSAAFQFLKSASEVRNLIAGQEALGAATGVAYKTITNSIKEATDGQIGYAEAARAAAIGTAAGLSPSQLDALGNAAKNASFALGRDLTDSFNRLVRGVTKAEPELLDELGIVLRLKDATEQYADAINKPVDELTQFERTQAVANDVLTQAEKKFGAIQKIMDPSAASLNKFLVSFESLINTIKEGIAGGLAPVFEFLSERTLSLTAALGLFAIPIVRSILPSFSDWGETAQKNFDMQSDKLKALDKDYDKIRSTIKNLGADRDQVLKGNEEFNRGLAKSAGIDTSSAKSTGKGGVDFLFGGAVSRESQKNAEMMLSRAQAQIDKHGQIVNSKLKGMNQQQLNDLKKSYAERAMVLKKFERQHATTYEKATLHVKTYVIKSKAAIASLQKFTAKASGRIAGALSTAFNIAGWIGIILLAVDGIKALIDVFFPLEESVKQANEAIEDFTDKSKTLNEELDKTAKTVLDIELLSVTEQVEAIGKAFQSADLNAKFKAFEALDPSNSNFPEAEQAFRGTLNALSDLNPEFKELASSLDLKNITEDAKNSMLELANSIMNTGASIANFRQLNREMFEELERLAGTNKKSLDPTVMLRENITKQVKEGELALAGVQAQITEIGNRTSQATKDAQANLDDLQAKNVDRFTTGAFGGTASSRAAEKERQLAEARAALAKAEAADTAENAKQLEEAQAQAEKLSQEYAFTLDIQEEMNKRSEKFNTIQETINSNIQKESQLRTNGLTIDEKLQNVEADRLLQSNKLLESNRQLLVAELEHSAATKEGANATAEQQARAIENLAIARSNNAAAVKANELQEELNLRKERQLQLEKMLLNTGTIPALNTRLENTKKLGNIQEQIQLATTVAEEARLKNQAKFLGMEMNINKQKLEQVQRQYEITQMEEGPNRTAAQALLNIQIEQTKQLERQLQLLKNQGAELALAGLDRETDRLRGEVQDFSFSPVQRRFNQERRRIENENGPMDQEQLNRLKDAVLAQQALNFELESMDALYNTISNSMTQALTGLISGTMSVKEAFAQMAKAIIQQLIQIIAQMIVMRILMSAFGMGGGSATFADGTSFSSLQTPTGIPFGPAGGARYGGIMTPKGYAAGGIATGRDGGYPAVLHGTEAVVPLPNNRSIPVELGGNAGSTNNVTVNVNVDNEGRATQTSEADGMAGANLGKAIANAVQQELLNQKRAGGILSPYGVA